jgi:5-methylcytosine-specific restriction endonuclease McrA
MSADKPAPPNPRLDRVVAEARRQRDERERGYRAQALRIHPWICTRCAREFDRTNVQQLTVHHRDHNHDHNPPDGSNWELLCVYCHDNEHARELEAQGRDAAPAGQSSPGAKWQPFAGLAGLMERKK